MLICHGLICYFSKSTTLFGHISKTIVAADVIHKVIEDTTSCSITVQYRELSKKGHQKMAELHLYFPTASHRNEVTFYISSLIGNTTPIPLDGMSFELSRGNWATLTSNPKTM